MKSLQAVLSLVVVLFLLLSASLLYAGSTQIVNAPCEKAIAQATVLAAHRKRASLRPYQTAPTLNIESNRNYAKRVLLPFGEVWSHKKYGELAFDATGDASCSVTSNGHPADVLLSDLLKAFGHPIVASLSTIPSATELPAKRQPSSSAPTAEAKVAPQPQYVPGECIQTSTAGCQK